MAPDISILHKKTVISMEEVQPGKSFNLSVLDCIMEPCNLRIILYYRFPSDTNFGMLKKKLCLSLNELLSKLPIVTGRLTMDPKLQGRWMIKCNDAGLRVMEARVEGSLEEWLESLDREKELKLLFWEEMFRKPYFWSTFYVQQLTEFEGGGLAIGLSCSHLLVDATSATMFIKAWADTNLFGKMLSPPLFHPLPPRKIFNKVENHELYTDLINHYKSSMERINPIKTSHTEEYSTVTFTFTDKMVRRCMAEASKSTPFAALAALFWVCISKVKGKKEGLINMNICLDMRNVLGLRKEFFGNCMVFNKVFGEELKEVGLANAAKAIENVVSRMGNEGIMDLIEWLDENYSRDRSSLTPMNGPDLMCANWDNLDSYSAEFESGVEPVRVSYYLEPIFGEGQVLILPSPKGEEGSMSRVAMVTLPKDQAVKLCEETLILSFSPKILMKNKG
ncbi:Transferase [Macleaya cordata]|uniref:Transferase n=1 Tax=Macleaya cordata TaxID=56857 RepID=A0A200Q7S2_MACCD|nr:Transferase [Macleaya cordata]